MNKTGNKFKQQLHAHDLLSLSSSDSGSVDKSTISPLNALSLVQQHDHIGVRLTHEGSFSRSSSLSGTISAVTLPGLLPGALLLVAELITSDDVFRRPPPPLADIVAPVEGCDGEGSKEAPVVFVSIIRNQP